MSGNDEGDLTLMSPTSETQEGLRQRVQSPRDETENDARQSQRSPGRDREEQQPLRQFEVQQIDLLSVDRVDAITHTFQANLFLQLILRDGGLDPELSHPDAVFPVDAATGKPTYRPSAKWFWDKVEFANAVSIEFKDVHPVRREGDDLVLRFRVSGTFVEVMELQEFPFDVQALTFSIQLNCRTTGPMPVRFAVPSDLETSVDSEGIALIALEYETLGDLIVEATEVERAKGRLFPTLRVSMMLKRRPTSVLINCALPMGVFAFLSGLQFLIPVSDQGTRLEVTLNLILTAAAYKYAISSMTPDVPYLTILDKYSLAVFGFITMVTVEAAVMGYFAVSDKYYAPGTSSQKLVDLVDWIMMIASASAFCWYHVYFFWRTGGGSWQERRLLDALALVQHESVTVRRYPSLMRKVSSELAQNLTNAVGDVGKRARNRGRVIPKAVQTQKVAPGPQPA